MNKLLKLGAVATIVGTIFTIWYFSRQLIKKPFLPKKKKDIPEESSSEDFGIKQKYENLIYEINGLPVLSIDEIRGRHMAALEIPSYDDQSKALFSLVKFCLKSSQFDYAYNVCGDIPSYNIESDAYSAVALYLAFVGDYDIALVAARQIPSYDKMSKTLRAIVELQYREK